jgi:cobalt/nickel transport system permease protein
MLVEERLSEGYAAQDGLLQSLDPRFKLIAVLLLIIVAGMATNLLVLIVLWILSMLFMRGSHLPVLRLQKGIWGVIPLFTLLVSVPGMFNLINDGTPLLILHHFTSPVSYFGLSMPERLFLSQQGVKAGLFLFLRVGVSLSMGVLLTVTTPVADLLRSLQVLRVPQIFVMIMEMSYRYLILLLTVSVEMFEARQLRTVGNISSQRSWAQIGSSIAALFARSMGLADEVYQAMNARCYTGQAVGSEEIEFHRQDLLAAGVLLVIILSLALGGRLIV